MQTALLILEVSQKQAYIFGDKRIRENAERSLRIVCATSSAYFETLAAQHPDGSGVPLYDASQNLVYTGGGHTILRFPSRETACAFAQLVTKSVLCDFPGMELFAKVIEYDESKSVGENLDELTRQLERKKNLRVSAFRQGSFGGDWTLPATAVRPVSDPHPLPHANMFPNQFDKLAGKDNFIAVVHIDGNAMGDRVRRIYETVGNDLDGACWKLQDFSLGIDEAFQDACCALVEELYRLKQQGSLDFLKLEDNVLPFRRVVSAGDDICFVTAGKLGLFCAKYFIQRLTRYPNKGEPLAACAGVAMVHQKYPFHHAYELSEELCGEAKKFGASLDPSGKISAMDWHIEFGQLNGSLSHIRRTNYRTEDGNYLNLRPVVVAGDEGQEPYRHLDTMENLMKALGMLSKRESNKVARSKLKALRESLSQGVKETEFALEYMQIKAVNDEIFSSLHGWSVQKAFQALTSGTPFLKEAFVTCCDQQTPEGQANPTSGVADHGQSTANPPRKHCLLFDPIELMDHVWMPEEVTK